ncbi:MAG: bifunctional hydroxymethylpyrimidine kinase/phosphomethylpyrimidine kinase [Verrucomicrobia bacterium]|nr:bifunctional hydroxymethylpyrimidine kinase/phosphomethylpyrimidine kinase [Verrucomicrobiota bacterium]
MALLRVTQPIALTIAGSDSGGGAGIQADLKTFAALGVHGTTAITCVTAQNPERVLAVQECRPDMVRKQIEAVFAEMAPSALKTGMLFSTEIIRVVANVLRLKHRLPLVVDPVMIATSGGRLMKASALKTLLHELLPLSALVTPNVDEARVLAEVPIRSPEDLRTAARRIHHRFGCAALVKGGHLSRLRQAIDIYYDGRTELMLEAPFLRGFATHGTGCTYSAAIAAYLALGKSLPSAVTLAKQYVTEAIARSGRAAGHWVLGGSP